MTDKEIEKSKRDHLELRWQNRIRVFRTSPSGIYNWIPAWAGFFTVNTTVK